MEEKSVLPIPDVFLHNSPPLWPLPPQMCSPIMEISTSLPQLEHLIEGSILGARMVMAMVAVDC